MADTSADFQDPDYEDYTQRGLLPQPRPQPAVIAPPQPRADSNTPSALPSASAVADTVASDGNETANRSVLPRAGRASADSVLADASAGALPGETYEEAINRRQTGVETGVLPSIRSRYVDPGVEAAAHQRDLATTAAAAEQTARDTNEQQKEWERQQAQAQHAQIAHWKNQGMVLEHTPEGDVRPQTREDGSLVYTPKSHEPFQWKTEEGGDGAWYQDHRNDRGEMVRQNLQESGQYHTDALTGERYITLTGGARQNIGVDDNVVKVHQLREQQDALALQEAQDTALLQQRKMALRPLEDQLTAARKVLKPDKAEADFAAAQANYAPGGAMADPDLWNAAQKAHATFLEKWGPLQQQVDQHKAEIEALETKRANNALARANGLADIRTAQRARYDRNGTNGTNGTDGGAPADDPQTAGAPKPDAGGLGIRADGAIGKLADAQSHGVKAAIPDGKGNWTLTGPEHAANVVAVAKDAPVYAKSDAKIEREPQSSVDESVKKVTDAWETAQKAILPQVEEIKAQVSAGKMSPAIGKAKALELFQSAGKEFSGNEDRAKMLGDALARFDGGKISAQQLNAVYAAAQTQKSGVETWQGAAKEQSEKMKGRLYSVADGKVAFANDPAKYQESVQQAVQDGVIGKEDGAKMIQAVADNGVGTVDSFVGKTALTASLSIERGMAQAMRWFHADNAAKAYDTEADKDARRLAGEVIPGDSSDGKALVNPALNNSKGAVGAEVLGNIIAMLPAMAATSGMGTVASLPKLKAAFDALKVGTLAPKIIGLAPMALQAGATAGGEAHAAEYQKAITEGKSEADALAMADKAAKQAGIESIPATAAFGAAGEVSGALMKQATKVLPLLETPLARGIGTFGVNALANVGASTGLRVAEGGNAKDFTAAGVGQDLAWAAMGAKHGWDAAKYIPTAREMAAGTHSDIVGLRSWDGTLQSPMAARLNEINAKLAEHEAKNGPREVRDGQGKVLEERAISTEERALLAEQAQLAKSQDAFDATNNTPEAKAKRAAQAQKTADTLQANGKEFLKSQGAKAGKPVEAADSYGKLLDLHSKLVDALASPKGLEQHNQERKAQGQKPLTQEQAAGLVRAVGDQLHVQAQAVIGSDPVAAGAALQALGSRFSPDRVLGEISGNPLLARVALVVGNEGRGLVAPEALKAAGEALGGGDAPAKQQRARLDQLVGAHLMLEHLGTAATTGQMDGNAGALFERLGLVRRTVAEDGTTRWRLTEDGIPFLQKGLREAVAKDPSRFNVDVAHSGEPGTVARALDEAGVKREAEAVQAGSGEQPRFHVRVQHSDADGGDVKEQWSYVQAQDADHAKHVAERPVREAGRTVIESEAVDEPKPNEKGNQVEVSEAQAQGLFHDVVKGYAADLRKLGIKVINRLDKEHSDMLRSGGVFIKGDRLSVSFAKLAESLSTKLEPGESPRSLMEAMIHEEFTHAAALEALHTEAAEEHAGASAEEIRDAAKAKAEKISQTATKGMIRAMRRLYPGWDALNDFQKGHEMLAAVLTGKYRGTVTSAIYKAVQKIVRYMVGRVETLPESSPLRRSVATVEARSRELQVELGDRKKNAFDASSESEHSDGDGRSVTEQPGTSSVQDRSAGAGSVVAEGATGRDGENGAPVGVHTDERGQRVSGETAAAGQDRAELGNEISLKGEAVPLAGAWKAKNPDGPEVFSGKWALAPLDGPTVNAQFGEGQDRIDRDRTGAAQRLSIIQHFNADNVGLAWAESPSLSDGAPTMTADGSVLAGNNRLMSLRDMVAAHPEKAKIYQEWVRQKAAELGLDAQAMGDRPVALVRVVNGDLGGMDKSKFVQSNNTPGTERRSVAEVALQDRKVLADKRQGVLFAAPVVGMKLREVGTDFPMADSELKLMDVRKPNADIAQNSAFVFRQWPKTMEAADGSSILLHNPEKGSLGTRIKHLTFNNEENRLDPEKAKWLPMVPETLAKAAVRLVDSETGNRIYVAQYKTGDKHMVIVKPDGEVLEQKGFRGALITQFRDGPSSKRMDFSIDWVNPSYGTGPGRSQGNPRPTPTDSTHPDARQSEFQKQSISDSQGSQGADASGEALHAAEPEQKGGEKNGTDELQRQSEGKGRGREAANEAATAPEGGRGAAADGAGQRSGGDSTGGDGGHGRGHGGSGDVEAGEAGASGNKGIPRPEPGNEEDARKVQLLKKAVATLEAIPDRKPSQEALLTKARNELARIQGSPEIDKAGDWRKLFSDEVRSTESRRAAKAGQVVLRTVRSRDSGVQIPEGISREISASIHGVGIGAKPLYHDHYGSDLSGAIADVLRQHRPPGVVVHEENGHIYAYSEKAVRAVIDRDPQAYPGATLFDKIRGAVERDHVGELLGYGVSTRDKGDTLVLIRDSSGKFAFGFRTSQAKAEDRGAMFAKVWSDIHGEGHDFVVMGDKPKKEQSPISAEDSPLAAAPVEAAAHEAATSPKNELLEPTEPQKKAGNYRMGHIRVGGMDISVENPEGSKRSGVDKDGKPWETEMKAHYGYLRGTEGKDGDHVDVFVKPGTPEDFSGPVYVVNQVDPASGKFDEHKAVIGAGSREEAQKVYESNYGKGWKGLGSMVEMPLERFKEWAAEKANTKKEAMELPGHGGSQMEFGNEEAGKKTEQADALSAAVVSPKRQVARLEGLLKANREGKGRQEMEVGDGVASPEVEARAKKDGITSAESRMAEALGVKKNATDGTDGTHGGKEAAEKNAKLAKELEALEPKVSKLDGVKERARGFSEWVKRLWEENTQLPAEDPYKRAVNRYTAKLQASELNVMEMTKHILDKVPDALTREGITNWRVAQGDENKLRLWAEMSVDPKLKAGYEAALRLTPEQKEIATTIDEYYKSKLALGQERGMLEHGVENYASQIWRDDKGKKIDMDGVPSAADYERDSKGNLLRDADGNFILKMGKKFQQGFAFANARQFEDFFTGESQGFRPLTKDCASLLGIYGSEFNRTLALREFVKELTEVKAADGRPIAAVGVSQILRAVKEGEPVDEHGAFHIEKPENSQGYKNVNHPVFERWKYTMPVQPGEEAMELPGQVRSQMEFGNEEAGQFGNEEAGQFGNEGMGGPSAEKGKTVAMLRSGNLLVHPDFEKKFNNLVGESGIRNWYNSKGTAMMEIPKAIVRAIDWGNKEMKGLTFVGSPFHLIHLDKRAAGYQINPFTDLHPIDTENPLHRRALLAGLMIAPDKNGIGRWLEGLGGADSSFAAKIPIAKEMAHYCFESFIPRLKMKAWTTLTERMVAKFKPELESGKMSVYQVENYAARITNNAFGHLNYAEMGRNPTLQHIIGLATLAPDFSESTLRHLGDAARGLNPASQVGRESFKSIMVLAAGTMFVAKTLNKLIDGEWHMDHPFSVVVGNREYSVRSQVADLQHMYRDWRGYLMARMSPVAKTLWQVGTQKNYRGESMGWTDQARDFIASWIPATLRALPGMNKISPTDAVKNLKWYEQFTASMGMKVARYSATREVNQLADKFLQAKGRASMQGAYTPSRFTALKNSLDDGDTEGAKAAYKQLATAALDEAKRKAKGGVSVRNPISALQNGFYSSVFHPIIGDTALNAEFVRGLTTHERELYQKSLKERNQIWMRFQKISGADKMPPIPSLPSPVSAAVPNTLPGAERPMQPMARRRVAGEPSMA